MSKDPGPGAVSSFVFLPQNRSKNIGLAKKFVSFFSVVVLSGLSLHSKQVVRLYCDSRHISIHLKENLPKLVNFCIAIFILKMEENKQNFGIACFIISRR